MCERALFVFTSPGWLEYNKHWAHLTPEQLSFSESKGKVLHFDGKEYGISGWDIRKINNVVKQSIQGTERGVALQELAILIHETAPDTLAKIRLNLSESFPNLVKPLLVYGYTSAADNDFFREHIEPIGQEAPLPVDHFERLWHFIWTDDSYRKAIENRSRTLLPFISLHLLMTAKCVSLPEDIQSEINRSRSYYDLFFDSLNVPPGKCLADFKALKNMAGAGLIEEGLQQINIEDFGRSIQTLLACLNNQLTAFMNRNSEAV